MPKGEQDRNVAWQTRGATVEEETSPRREGDRTENGRWSEAIAGKDGTEALAVVAGDERGEEKWDEKISMRYTTKSHKSASY